jgi:hypothetical protein
MKLTPVLILDYGHLDGLDGTDGEQKSNPQGFWLFFSFFLFSLAVFLQDFLTTLPSVQICPSVQPP